MAGKEKGEFGYLNYRKKLNLIKMIVSFAVVAAVLIIGFIVYKTRANIFTVAAIVLVLPAAKMTQEESKEEYFLVSEAGFLLVFCSDKSTICLYTHIPVTDFPERERARLMEGIWFPSMMDVYHYLESYTS